MLINNPFCFRCPAGDETCECQQRVDAFVAQWIERRPSKPQVESSNLSERANG